MTTTLTLASPRKVPIQGNFTGANIKDGTRYSVVVRRSEGPAVIAQVTSQSFSTGRKFSTTVSLDAGTYAIGNGKHIGDVYVVDSDGKSDASHGAANVTSTLKFGLEGFIGHQSIGARG